MNCGSSLWAAKGLAGDGGVPRRDTWGLQKAGGWPAAGRGVLAASTPPEPAINSAIFFHFAAVARSEFGDEATSCSFSLLNGAYGPVRKTVSPSLASSGEARARLCE